MIIMFILNFFSVVLFFVLQHIDLFQFLMIILNWCVNFLLMLTNRISTQVQT
jgi:hypothetical protein